MKAKRTAWFMKQDSVLTAYVKQPEKNDDKSEHSGSIEQKHVDLRIKQKERLSNKTNQVGQDHMTCVQNKAVTSIH
jgi:hypothetical protein